MTDRPKSTSTSDPVLKAGRTGQLVAAAGAVLSLLGAFGPWVSGAGVLTLILGVVLAAPVADLPGPFLAQWWMVAALAALAGLIGFGLTFVASVPGGLLLVVGAVAALVALGLGTPAGAGGPAGPVSRER